MISRINRIFKQDPVKFVTIVGCSLDLLLLAALLIVRGNPGMEKLVGMSLCALAVLTVATIIFYFKHLYIIQDRETGERFMELRYRRWTLRV